MFGVFGAAEPSSSSKGKANARLMLADSTQNTGE